MSVPLLLRSVLLAALLGTLAGVRAGESLALKTGDRVALVGSGLIEQERISGYLETRLTCRFPEASVLYRNLGWSGDTVQGDARTAGLGKPDGLARLLREVREAAPTIIFIGYGANESFEGVAGLPAFLGGFSKLLDGLAPLKARVVVLSPAFHEDLGRPSLDPAEHNRALEQYTAALKDLAAGRQLWFVDLFHPLAKAKEAVPMRRLTTNGVLPNENGYALIAAEVERELLGAPVAWRVEVDQAGKVLAAKGADVGEAKAEPNGLRFNLTPATLPALTLADLSQPRQPTLRVAALAPGRYLLRIDGQDICRAAADDWQQGVTLSTDPALEQTQKLRAAIIHKNDLFYRRWRPFNDYSEHWGYIAGDFKRYDKRIAQDEALIARLRRAVPLHCEIVKEKGTK
jgi:lysophospholipase L1-like esterase